MRQPVADLEWSHPQGTLELPDNGELLIVGDAPPGPLQVRYRQGGEVLHLPDRGHRDLKRLLNESGVPWFVRGRLPLVYRDGQLLAVANLTWRGSTGGPLATGICSGNHLRAIKV